MSQRIIYQIDDGFVITAVVPSGVDADQFAATVVPEGGSYQIVNVLGDVRVIYPTDDGGVAVLVPADGLLTIEQIAAKDVPAGKPYKVVDVSEIPTDRTFRGAWEYAE
ncbi:hypothetical protein H0A64_07180 [Alcaligenaceae bacterium]|nr:hypothetical protein [Alcaligenaceae bacterium]